MRAAVGFIGITQPEVIAAEGMAIGPEQRASAIAEADRRLAGVTANAGA